MKDALRSFSEVGHNTYMYYAYILRSETHDQYYYGSTADLQQRLIAHNAGQSLHTRKYKPWVIIWYGAFTSKKQAQSFEKYLKSASGKAFIRKRLIL